MWEKAVEYLHQSGRKASSRSATPEAISYFEQALDALQRLPEAPRTVEMEINIRIDLGPALIVTKGFQSREVENNYTRARVLCEQFAETPLLFPVIWGLARSHDARGELRLGRKLGEQLLSVAKRVQEPALLLEAHHENWANLISLGELRSARTHIEQGFALYDPQKHRHHAFLYGGHDPGVCCAYHAADVLWLLGYPDKALQKSHDSLALAHGLSHPSTLSNALAFAAWFHQHRGEWQAVQTRVEEAMTLATEQGFSARLAQAHFLQGWLLFERGEKEAGIAQMSKFPATERVGRVNAHSAAMLADAYGKAGQPAAGLNLVDMALTKAHQTDCRYYEAELHRIKGELLLTRAAADERESEACFEKALDVARGQSAKSLELRAAMSLCRLWQRQGKKSEAQNLLAEVYGWFTEGFDTADLNQAKLLLEELA